ncbi:MAG: AAA family ATPase, partial [Pseudomonadota bacterium]|nr:AAA family ATPase [Pseudomonadota bacterium]
MAIDFATFTATAPFILDARLPVLLRGRHGVGKSQVVYQIAEERGLPVVERRASQMTEGDLLGLPDTADTAINGRKATTWNAPDWLVTACEQGVLLFLDEVDRATMEVRQGLFELTDSRKLNGWHLHADTLIVAAVNGGEHGAQNQVGEMDPAELDRWTVFDVEPTTEDWLKWANGRVPSIVWDFINHNRKHLEHEGDFEPNKVYPSRRSWDRFCTTAEPAGVFGEDGDRDLLFNLATAFVGFEAAVTLRDFVEKYEWQVTIEDILDSGDFDKVSKWGINDHAAMIEKFEAAEVFTEELNESQVTNLAEYFVRLPSEIAMKLWTVLGDADNMQN